MTAGRARRRDRLWNLLPEYHRIKDAEAGYPLRGLLGSIGAEFARVESDIEEAWNDEFIETCRPWVIPYIAELLGIELIHDVDGTARADVGLTTSFRKRQGTLAMLEELAETVTGWETVVVEMYRRLSWTQHLNYQDHGRTTCDLRAPGALQLIGTPFDLHEYTVDVRPPSPAVARPNLSNIAFFLHRLVEDPFERVRPRPASTVAGEWRFFLHPAGVDTPLFHRVKADDERDRRVDEGETHSPIRTGWLTEHLKEEDQREKTGVSSRVLEICSDGLVLTGERRSASAAFLSIRCADLSSWRRPPPGTLYIDPARGRIACAPEDRLAELSGDLEATFSSGAAGAVGARGRQRSSSTAYDLLEDELDEQLPSPDDANPEGWQLLTVGRDGVHATLGAAISAWTSDKAVIRILDSSTYEENVTFVPRIGNHLVIQAAEGQRPFVLGDVRMIGGPGTPPIDDRMRLTLDGLHISGHLRVTAAAAVDTIGLVHCSVWPMEESLAGAEPAAARGIALLGAVGRLFLARSSVGGIETTSAADRLVAVDSIIDGHGDAAIAGEGGVRSGPATELARTTVVGSLVARELDASDCIILGQLVVRRAQVGCLRYSFVPLFGDDWAGVRTPRRYRCQPDLALTEAAEALGEPLRQGDPSGPGLTEEQRRTVQLEVTPQFATLSPTAPDYATLLPDAPLEIRRGAEQGLEMGAWNFRQDPRRIDNLRRRLDDYLPFGLRPEIVFTK
jgi:hypothetical protein